jgi:hypothetical protein
MFRIEAFCDDKNLARVLHALAGLVLAAPKITPVANAQAKNGEVKAASSGEVLPMLSSYLKKRRLDVVNATVVREFAVAHGYSAASYSHILKKATQARLLRKRGKGTKSSYAVIGEM